MASRKSAAKGRLAYQPCSRSTQPLGGLFTSWTWISYNSYLDLEIAPCLFGQSGSPVCCLEFYFSFKIPRSLQRYWQIRSLITHGFQLFIFGYRIDDFHDLYLLSTKGKKQQNIWNTLETFYHCSSRYRDLFHGNRTHRVGVWFNSNCHRIVRCTASWRSDLVFNRYSSLNHNCRSGMGNDS